MPEGFNLGTAYAAIELNTDGIKDGLDKAKKGLSDGLKELGSGLQEIGGNMTLIGAPFLAFGAVAVKAFTDSQKVAAQLSAVLKSTGGAAGVTEKAALDLASGLQKVTMFSDETVLSAENMLLTFTNIGQNVFPDATKTVLDMSQALGQDTKSSAIQLGKALNDPIKGITALTRVGVTFTESQKDMIKQLVAAGKTEEAQKVILQELQKEFGGSAVAAGKTFAGQLEITKNKLDDMMETIGQRLLPIVQRFIDGISGLVDWFSNLDPHIQDVIVGIGALLASFAIIGPIIAAVGTAISAVGGILAGVGTVIGVILSPIGLLIAAGAAIVYVFRDQIGAFFSGFIADIQSGAGVFQAFGAAILDVFGSNPITLWLANTLVGIQNFLNNWKLNWSLIELFATYYIQNVILAVQRVIEKIQEWISQNPAFSAAIIGLGVVVGGLTLILAAIPVVMGIISVAAGVLTGALGLLFSPVVLLAAAIAGIVYAADKLYPGGIVKLFNDASTAAKELAFLGMYVLATAASFVKARIDELILTIHNALDSFNQFVTITKMVGSGQLSIGQVIQGATTGSIGGGSAGGGKTGLWKDGVNVSGGIVPIPPVGGGSAAPRAGGGDVMAGMPYIVGEREPELFVPRQNGSILNGSQMGGMGGFTWTGDINISANDYAGGRAATRGALDEIEERYRSRGN